MLRFMAQLDYLRDVQSNFGTGGTRIDLVEVFLKIMSVAGPVILLMALWHYRNIIMFMIMRFFAHILSPRGRKVVSEYLVKKGVMLDIYLYTSKGPTKHVGNARVTEVRGGKMKLQLVNIKPTALNLKNVRVICFTKPFTYSGRKINAFVTFVGHMLKRGSVIKEISLLTPVRYRFMVRRKHNRQRVAREGAVRVKAWDIRKRKTFWMVKPDLQTVNNPARYGKKMRLSVENISAGGMRMFLLNSQGQTPSLSEGNQLILRVSVWNPKSKKFSYFNVIGTIRSRFKGKGGAIGMGIQFTAEGEKVGSGYIWKTLPGEMKALAQFLEKTSK